LNGSPKARLLPRSHGRKRLVPCTQILDAYGWDLDAAVQAMLDKDTYDIPEYQESMQAATRGNNSETILTSSSTSLVDDIIESTTTPINGHGHADERSIFERIGDGGNLYDLRQGWKKTRMLQMLFNLEDCNTLPFVLLRGSCKLIFGAVGLVV
jgi:hypothetical protein